MGFTERLKDANGIQLITGSVPLDKWKALLEQGNPLIEGSGWGEVRDLKVEGCRFKPNTKARHLTPSLVGPKTY
jgi:hypothetical protein